MLHESHLRAKKEELERIKQEQMQQSMLAEHESILQNINADAHQVEAFLQAKTESFEMLRKVTKVTTVDKIV